MKKLRSIFMVFGIIAGLIVFTAPATQAINPFGTACDANSSATLCASKGDSAMSLVHKIINLLIYAVGIIAVIMIVIGGLRYTVSSGDQAGVTTAKNTVMYAVIGLVVAVLSYAVVNLVITRL